MANSTHVRCVQQIAVCCLVLGTASCVDSYRDVQDGLSWVHGHSHQLCEQGTRECPIGCAAGASCSSQHCHGVAAQVHFANNIVLQHMKPTKASSTVKPISFYIAIP
jgi:hypothetical protein